MCKKNIYCTHMYSSVHTESCVQTYQNNMYIFSRVVVQNRSRHPAIVSASKWSVWGLRSSQVAPASGPTSKALQYDARRVGNSRWVHGSPDIKIIEHPGISWHNDTTWTSLSLSGFHVKGPAVKTTDPALNWSLMVETQWWYWDFWIHIRTGF